MEPWERVWIDAETFAEDVHSYINCTECHAGQAVDDFEAAHDGLKSAAVESQDTCGRCHVDLEPHASNSLHNTLQGYDTVLYERSAPEHYAAIEEMQANHCNDCHATCGDCHVSQPNSVGGGLVSGHDFNARPSMSQNCTACHGSRVKNEYYGANEGIPSDVHFRARMSCMDCHTGDEMHGKEGASTAHRYDGIQSPSCEDCHEDVIGEDSEIREHAEHGTDLLSCQVCHSTEYVNCVNCHVEQTDDGTPFFSVEDNFFTFVIGLNPERTDERPYMYVPLRHVPIDRDSFSFYGENLLPNFDSRPTWVYATPHNIQRITPQAETCNNCHREDELFLTEDTMEDLIEDVELQANLPVMVEEVPE